MSLNTSFGRIGADGECMGRQNGGDRFVDISRIMHINETVSPKCEGWRCVDFTCENLKPPPRTIDALDPSGVPRCFHEGPSFLLVQEGLIDPNWSTDPLCPAMGHWKFTFHGSIKGSMARSCNLWNTCLWPTFPHVMVSAPFSSIVCRR